MRTKSGKAGSDANRAEGTCAERIAALPRRTDAELAALWVKVAGRIPPPAQRGLLLRELAYRIQAKAQGGLDAATRRLLTRAVRALGTPSQNAAHDVAQDAARAAEGETSGSEAPTTAPRRGHGDASAVRVRAAELPASARLVRVWPMGGARHEVLVLDGGKAFEYRGRRYTSLTPIAREITGTHWSGPRFFGLTTRRGIHRRGAESAEEGSDMNGEAHGT
jgi:hypothetical protein